MRPKFRENKGSFYKIDQNGSINAVWRKGQISISTFFHYSRIVFGDDQDITLAVLKGREAKEAIKAIRRIYNQDTREKRKSRKKAGQTQGRGVKIRADQIHLSVGAVNEPSEFSVNG